MSSLIQYFVSEEELLSIHKLWCLGKTELIDYGIC